MKRTFVSRYLIILIAALAVSLGFGWYGHILGQNIDLYLLLVSFAFSVLYVPVVIKLPVFKNYYVTDTFNINKTHHNSANGRIAPVAVGLVTSVTLGVFLFFLGVPNPAYHAFCGGVSALIISFIYEPKF